MTDRETVLSVMGMTCGSCAKHVDRALRAVPFVTEVDVRLREKRVVVRHPAGPVASGDLIAALRAAGYDGAPAT
jgi:copper chaperone CopZ